MAMKFEAAVITEKRSGEAFNTDSVNINGKVLPREVILNGYKGAGVINDKSYFALVSSFVEGYADAAVVSYEERSSEFSVRGANPVSVMNDYFRNTVGALNNLKHVSREISIGTIFAGNRNVVIGRSGETGLYAYRNGELSKVNPDNSMHDDGKSNYGCYTFNDVSVNDIFLLISPGAISTLTDKDLTDICRISEGSVKKIVNIIKRVASAKPASGGIGVIALKILENDLSGDTDADGFVADFSALADSEEAKNVEDNTDNSTDNTTEEDYSSAPAFPDEPVTVVGGFNPETVIEAIDQGSVEAEPVEADMPSDSQDAVEDEEEEKPVKKSKLGKIIITVLALIIIAGVLYAVATFTNIFGKKPANGEGDVSGITVGDETTVEESTTEEETTEEESTTEESTTVAEETTTRRRTNTTTTTEQSTTRRATQSTTEAPTEASTEAPVTETPATTEEPAESTEPVTDAPTEAPTEATEAPTEDPTEATDSENYF